MFYELDPRDREVLALYYPVPDRLFKFIVAHQYRLFPPRFFTKTHFCPSLDKEFVLRVIAERNNWPLDTKHVHIVRFLIEKAALKKYAIGNLSNVSTRIVCHKRDLPQMNKEIVGLIECVESKQIGNVE